MHDHTIILKSDNSVHQGLEIDNVVDGTRDKSNNLLQEGCVTFRTPKTRKLFSIHFSEFSFLFPAARRVA